MIPQRKAIHLIDPNGKPVVKVPLANSELFATVDRDSFERLMDSGLSSNWYFNKSPTGNRGYVRCSLNGTRVCVSRLIVNAKQQQNVFYLNNDTLDLRIENLYLEKGQAKKSWILRDIPL